MTTTCMACDSLVEPLAQLCRPCGAGASGLSWPSFVSVAIFLVTLLGGIALFG